MNNIKYDFTDKEVLVIGGSRGIGKGVVDAFLSSNAKVSYVSRKPMQKEPANLNYYYCDIKSENEIDKLFTNFSSIDILINVAGINFCKKINQISSNEWDDVIDVNLKSFFLIIKNSIEIMKEGSKIVNVSSIAGRHRSLVSGVHYVSSKAGIIGLTRQLAFELGNKGININCVCPSQTLTDMLKESMTKSEQKTLANSIPLKRLGSVEEQVAPIMFLSSNESSYMTGSILDINGGQF
jgi:NAD(P)-dependent dehydrogenase (short-subunit alcohol dehydrogenase family)